MPGIEGLAIWCDKRKWRDLAGCKAPTAWFVQLTPQKGIDFMGVQRTEVGQPLGESCILGWDCIITCAAPRES